METKSTLFIMVLAIAAGVFTKNAGKLVRYLSFGKQEDRLTSLPERIKQTLLVGFAQTKILRDKVAGPIHAGIGPATLSRRIFVCAKPTSKNPS